jgi:hypothetical protein
MLAESAAVLFQEDVQQATLLRDVLEEAEDVLVAGRHGFKFTDAREGVYLLDVTEEEAEELGSKGRKQARGGRPRKSA